MCKHKQLCGHDYWLFNPLSLWSWVRAWFLYKLMHPLIFEFLKTGQKSNNTAPRQRIWLVWWPDRCASYTTYTTWWQLGVESTQMAHFNAHVTELRFKSVNDIDKPSSGKHQELEEFNTAGGITWVNDSISIYWTHHISWFIRPMGITWLLLPLTAAVVSGINKVSELTSDVFSGSYQTLDGAPGTQG